MGNEQSNNHSQALVKAEQQGRELVRLRQEIETLRNESELHDVKRERDMFKCQAELIKGISLIREETERRERDQREYYHKIFLFFFVAMIAIMWLMTQKEPRPINQGTAASQCHGN